jgi:hypothetical protein
MFTSFMVGCFALLAAALALPAPASAQQRVPPRFKPGEYIWLMGSDLYPQSPIPELKRLEDQNLVIPNVKQRTPGWPGTYREIFLNLNDFRQALARGLSRRSVQVVIYNPEQFSDRSTPPSELEHPIEAVRTFAGLAHDAGFVAAYAPSCHLIMPGAMHIWRNKDPNPLPFWKACADHLWSKAAPYVDLIDLQVQGIQQDVAKYQAAVRYAAPLIRAANPNIKILAQVSTQVPPGNAAALYAPAYSVQNVVDGYFLSYRWTVPSEQRTIVDFLTRAVDTFRPMH